MTITTTTTAIATTSASYNDTTNDIMIRHNIASATDHNHQQHLNQQQQQQQQRRQQQQQLDNDDELLEGSDEHDFGPGAVSSLSLSAGSNKTGANFGKLVGKKAARLKELVLQNLGKADRTRDELFDLYELNFYKQQQQVAQLTKEFKTYLGALKHFHEASKSLNKCIQNATSDYQSARHDLVCENLTQVEVLNDDLLDKLSEQVVKQVGEYLSKFGETKEKISKRHRKLIDYDKSRRLYELTLAQVTKRRAKYQQNQQQQQQQQQQHPDQHQDSYNSILRGIKFLSHQQQQQQQQQSSIMMSSQQEFIASQLVDEARLLKFREQFNYCKLMYETINSELYDELPIVYDKKMKSLLQALQNYYALGAHYHSYAGKLLGSVSEVIDEMPNCVSSLQKRALAARKSLGANDRDEHDDDDDDDDGGDRENGHNDEHDNDEHDNDGHAILDQNQTILLKQKSKNHDDDRDDVDDDDDDGGVDDDSYESTGSSCGSSSAPNRSGGGGCVGVGAADASKNAGSSSSGLGSSQSDSLPCSVGSSSPECPATNRSANSATPSQYPLMDQAEGCRTQQQQHQLQASLSGKEVAFGGGGGVGDEQCAAISSVVATGSVPFPVAASGQQSAETVLASQRTVESATFDLALQNGAAAAASAGAGVVASVTAIDCESVQSVSVGCKSEAAASQAADEIGTLNGELSANVGEEPKTSKRVNESEAEAAAGPEALSGQFEVMQTMISSGESSNFQALSASSASMLEASDSASALYRVKTNYQYLAEDVDELCFDANEIIQVVEFDDCQEPEEGWLMGVREINGQRGLFPANFTTPI